MKIKKKQKVGAAILLSLMVVICFVAYTFKPSEVTLATEVKLRTIEVLNQDDSLTDEDLIDADKIRDWAMPVVEGTLKSQKITLTDDEYEKVFQALVKTLQSTYEAGNIKKDEDGNLTDLSKSYIANAVANAITYAVPSVDLESTVDTGTTQYEQILDMQKMLNSLDTSNTELKASIKTINQMYQQSVTNNEQTINVVSAAYDDKLDALYTELLAKISANTKTGERLSKDLSDLTDVVNKLLDTQKQILADLSTAVTNIQGLTEDVKNLQSTDESTAASLEEINNNITQINQSITQTQESLTTMINENVSKLTTEISSTKTSLTSDITATKNELSVDLKNQTDTITKRLNEIDKNLKDAATSDKEELTSKINDLSKKNEKDLSDAKTEIQAQINALTSTEASDVEALNERITRV